mmetsp:Transcript_61325/g.131845  ORF Transcript_61325/g.131845 Transcript_61325/m.131845 type:complete len:248 (+) Transcript_61325:227-970(+)
MLLLSLPPLLTVQNFRLSWGIDGLHVGHHAFHPTGAGQVSIREQVEILVLGVEGGILVDAVPVVDLRRVLEPDLVTKGVHLDTEPWVVHHTHEVPCGPLRLAILAIIPSANRKLSALGQDLDRNLDGPEDPAPTLAEFVRFLETLDARWSPILAVVYCHLHAVHRPSRPGVGVTAYGVSSLGHLDLGAVRRGPDRGVDVPVIDRVGPIGPNIFGRGDILRRDVLWKNSVIIDVVMINALLLGYRHLC